MKDYLMKRGSTLFLRAALTVIGLAVLALCIWAVPAISEDIEVFLGIARLQLFLMIGLYAVAALFLLALYQAFRLLNYVDRGVAFSELSVEALKQIKKCALAIGLLFVGVMPVVFMVAQKDDAPGLILFFGAIFIGAPVAVSVLAAVVQKLLKNAIELKAENELTV